MQTTKRGILARLGGMLAILALATMQQTSAARAMTSASQQCWGPPHCYVCTAEDEEGNYCLVFNCGDGYRYWCWL